MSVPNTPPTDTRSADAPSTSTRRIDGPGIFLALIFLIVAATAFTGTPFWILTAAAVKWVAAGAIALLGLVLLVTAGRRGSRR